MGAFRHNTTALAALGSALWLSAAVTAAAAADRLVSYSATARDLKSDRFLYREDHLVRYSGPQVVDRAILYTCRDGAPFGRKRVTYDADRLAPTFLFENALTGHVEGLRRDQRGATIVYRDSRGAREKSGPLPDQPGLVADAGFDEFVRKNWAALVAGERLRFDILVPSRLDYFSFRVRKLRSDAIEGIPMEVFRLTLSGIWGWILPGIDVWYRSTDRTLQRYVGLSNVQDDAGNNHKVTIEFAPGARRNVDASAFAAALDRPLTTTCG